MALLRNYKRTHAQKHITAADVSLVDCRFHTCHRDTVKVIKVPLTLHLTLTQALRTKRTETHTNPQLLTRLHQKTDRPKQKVRSEHTRQTGTRPQPPREDIFQNSRSLSLYLPKHRCGKRLRLTEQSMVILWHDFSCWNASRLAGRWGGGFARGASAKSYSSQQPRPVTIQGQDRANVVGSSIFRPAFTSEWFSPMQLGWVHRRQGQKREPHCDAVYLTSYHFLRSSILYERRGQIMRRWPCPSPVDLKRHRGLKTHWSAYFMSDTVAHHFIHGFESLLFYSYSGNQIPI